MLKRLLASTAIVAIASTAYAAETTIQQNAAAGAPHYMASVEAGSAFASTLIGMPVYGVATEARVNTTDKTAVPADKNAMNDKAAVPADKNAMTDKNAMPADTAAVENTGERIGDVNDLIVAQDGSIDAVVIGVGGFLGMGEKNVAVPFENLQWGRDADGNPQLHLAASKQQLEDAPNFDVAAMYGEQKQGAQNQDQMAQKTPAPAQDQMANKTPAATADQKMAANDTARNMDKTAAGDTAKMGTVDATQISADSLINTTVYDSADQNVGEVGDVVLTKDGQIDAIVLDVGGFLGIGEKPVAIAYEDLEVRKDENGNLVVYSAFTKEQLEAAPSYDKDAYESQRDTMRLHMQR